MEKFFDKIYPKFETLVVSVLILTLIVVIAYATFVYLETLLYAISQASINSVGEVDAKEVFDKMSHGLYQVFGAFLMILLGLELVHTIRVYFKSNSVKVESILVIAIIASTRHLIQTDFHEVDPQMIFALAFLLLVLIVGFFLLTRVNIPVDVNSHKPGVNQED